MQDITRGLKESSIGMFADHDDFTRLIFRAFLVLRLQVQVLHDHSAVVLEEACDFSNLTFLTACDDSNAINNMLIINFLALVLNLFLPSWLVICDVYQHVRKKTNPCQIYKE